MQFSFSEIKIKAKKKKSRRENKIQIVGKDRMLPFVLPPCLICNGKHHPISTSPTLHHAGWVYKGGQ